MLITKVDNGFLINYWTYDGPRGKYGDEHKVFFPTWEAMLLGMAGLSKYIV